MSGEGRKLVYIVDDDRVIRQSTHFLLTACGYTPRSFAGARDLLDELSALQPGCVLLDIRMPDIDGLQLLEGHRAALATFPVIVMTGHGDIGIAVRAMKQGAIDFIEKPFTDEQLTEMLDNGFAQLTDLLSVAERRAQASALIGRLTHREQEILSGLLAGSSTKVLAYDLGLSPRTVEMHRANMMEKLGVKSLSDALKLAIAAGVPAGA